MRRDEADEKERLSCRGDLAFPALGMLHQHNKCRGHHHLSVPVRSRGANASPFPGPSLSQLPEGLGSRGPSHRSNRPPFTLSAGSASKNSAWGLPDTLLESGKRKRAAPTFSNVFFFPSISISARCL